MVRLHSSRVGILSRNWLPGKEDLLFGSILLTHAGLGSSDLFQFNWLSSPSYSLEIFEVSLHGKGLLPFTHLNPNI